MRLRLRRELRRRIESLAERLNVNGPAGPAELLARVESAVEQLRKGEAGERTARLRLSDALDELSEGAVIVDEHGDEVFRNARGARFVGARHGDALVEEAMRELLTLAARGEPAEREIQIFGPPRRILHLRATPLDGEHQSAGSVVFISDVSQARHVEELRRDFVANVSHELRTPVGALELLGETIEAEHDMEVVRDLAARIGKEARRLGRIVEDLLDLSAIEAESEPVREPAPLRELMAEATNLVRGAAAHAGVTLLTAPPVGEAIVWCDRGHVVSALRNLLDNAIKYSEPPAAVDLGARIEGDRIVIWVSDHGIGIPARDLERVFERFYRVDRARTRSTGGTGLGLSIVRHVAEGHGGSVRVESTEGEGSTFYLELPVHKDVTDIIAEPG